MKNKLASLLASSMLLMLLNPIGSAIMVSAAGESGTIYPELDKFNDDSSSYNGEGGSNYIGYWEGYGQHAMHLQFQLAGTIDPARKLKSVQLVIPLLNGRVARNQSTIDPYIHLYGSEDDDWTEASGGLSDVPEVNRLTDLIETKTIAYDAYVAYYSGGGSKPPLTASFDVTAFIEEQLADTFATFVLDGPTLADKNEPDPSAADYFHVFEINDADSFPDYTGVPYLLYEYSPNFPPTALSLTSNTIAENTATGTTIGTFSATDPDAGETFTYSIVPGGDASSFSIVGNELLSQEVFDYETKSSYSLQVQVTDSAGHTFQQMITVQVSNVPEAPSLSAVQLNEGAPAANATSIMVAVAYWDPENNVSQLLLSNDGLTWSELVAAPSVPWTLTPGDGTKTVHVKARDADGLESSVRQATIVLDTTKPAGGLSIDGGQDYTRSSQVSLLIDYDDAEGMRFSNDGVSWSGWIPAAATHSWTLSEGDGLKTVHVELRDAAGNISSASDAITLDRTAPTGSLSINNGVAYATGPLVHLQIVYGDAMEMRLANSAGELAVAAWEPAAAMRGWTLSDGDGGKVVHLDIRDAAGNVSSYSHSIILDTVAPQPASITIQGGMEATSSRNVTLTIVPADAAAMRLSNTGSGWTEDDWTAVEPSPSWQLTEGDGLKTVYMQLRDSAGNISNWSDTIELDTVSPIISGVNHGDKRNTPVTVTFNEGSATLNGTPFASGGTISADNSYSLNVIDSAGNTTAMSFSIDATPPVISGVTNGLFYGTAVTPAYWDANPDSVLTATLNGEPFTSGTIVSADGHYSLRVIDDYGNEALMAFTIDRTAPTGSLTIHDGAAASTSLDVMLNISFADATDLELRLSNDGVSWGAWEAAASSRSWALSPGYGAKTVYMELKDQAGNVNAAAISDSILYRSIPTASNSSVTGMEDQLIDFETADFIYANADGIPVDAITILSLPSNGNLQLDGAMVAAGDKLVPADLAKLQFVPAAHWFGTTSFEWTAAADGLAAASSADMDLTVSSVNDVPSAEELQFTTYSGQPVDGQLQAVDVESDALTYATVDSPSKGTITLDTATGQFRYTPEPGHYSSVTFTYKANDGTDDSPPAVVTIVNHAPIVIIAPPPPKPVVTLEGLSGVPGVDATSELRDGREVIVITLDGDRLSDVIGKSTDEVIVIELGDKIDSAELGVDERLLELLDEGAKTLIVHMGSVRLGLSSHAIDELLSGWSAGDSKLVLEIKRADEATAGKLDRIAKDKEFALLGNPMVYQLYRQSAEGRTKLNSVKGYLTVTYGDEALKGQRPTTAVLLLPNDQVVHVPTRMEYRDGQLQMRVHSFAGGVFMLIAYETSFQDVAGWGKPFIDELASRLVVQGTGGGKFTPERSVTRAEFASILTGALGLYNVDRAGTFRDIEGDAWYSDSVAAAQAFGLINGYEDHTFRPDEQITREEAMVILARAFRLMELQPAYTEEEQAAALAAFKDQGDLQDWSAKAASFTILLGIVNGNGSELLPGAPMTREQLASVVVKLLQAGQFMN